MNRSELLRAWVDALESGKYEQGRNSLKSDSGYCCLGVLCEISGYGQFGPLSEITPDLVWRSEAYPGSASMGGGAKNYLPDEFRKEIGLSYSDQCDLAALNDDGESFMEIAATIRRIFPDVFPQAV